MPTIHSFDDTYPPARFDGVSWTRAHAELSVDGASGWTEVFNNPIALDPTPATPNSVDLTIFASVDQGYFRFRFSDSLGNFSPYSDVVFSPLSEVAPRLRPTINEVALLLRTRTVGGTQVGLGADTGPADITTFTDTSRPTSTEVERTIDTARDAIIGRLKLAADDIPDEHVGSVRHAAAVYAAILIEVSFFRESANEEQIRIWRDLIDDLIKTVVSDAVPGPGNYRFGTLLVGSIRTPPPPDYDPIEGIDF